MKNKFYITIICCITFLAVGHSQCYDQPHTPFQQDGWLSCQMSANPNPVHGLSHWIMYDLGWEYVLDSTHFWNFNAWGQSDMGIKDLIIDYSIDGTNWTNLGTFELAQATASVKYEGVAGINFNNTSARYVLLTGLSNWGTTGCLGLSEIRFNLSTSTSIDPELESTKVSMTITPNPVINEAQISFRSVEIPKKIELYDLSGKLLLEKSGLAVMNTTLDLSGLTGGIYFVKARLDGQVLTEKVIKL